MKYLIKDTTDGKHRGVRFQLLDEPEVGEEFIFRDISFKIREILKQNNQVTLFSDNYIIIMDEEE